MVGEVESIAAFDAQEIAIDTTLVTVVPADNLHSGFGPAHTQGGLAAVSAVGAGGSNVGHLPGPRLVAVGARSQRAHRADVNAHTALFAVQVIFQVGGNDGTHAAVLNAQRGDVHALVAHPHTAVAQNAAWPVKVDDRGPLLLVLMILGVDVFGLRGTVGECHVLQFALATGVAHRAVQGMVAQQHLHHGLPGLMDFIAVGGDNHSFADHRGAGGL